MASSMVHDPHQRATLDGFLSSPLTGNLHFSCPEVIIEEASVQQEPNARAHTRNERAPPMVYPSTRSSGVAAAAHRSRIARRRTRTITHRPLLPRRPISSRELRRGGVVSRSVEPGGDVAVAMSVFEERNAAAAGSLDQHAVEGTIATN